MTGPCTDCGRDSRRAKYGGSLWQPVDSDPNRETVRETKHKTVIVVPRALCADCRKDQDDGASPWRSA